MRVSKFSRLFVQTGILGAGAWLVIQHEASRARCSPACSCSARALAPVETAIGTWKSLVAARLARRRLGELVDVLPDEEPGMELPRASGELVVERLVFVPPGGDEPTLRGVSFELTPGEVLGIIGPSAAGKSTLARLIAGTWTPTAGKVRLDGADISVWHEFRGSHHIGYLPQDIELFSGSVRDNIARLGEAGPAAVIEAAKLVGLHESIMRLPRGYNSEIGDAGIKISGGQRQRIALARAVFGRPRLVVLDEPNASLDHEGEEALHSALAALKEMGTTIVMIAHRPSVLGLADKLLVLRHGSVEAYGSRAEVIAKLNAGRPRAVPMHKPAQPAGTATTDRLRERSMSMMTAITLLPRSSAGSADTARAHARAGAGGDGPGRHLRHRRRHLGGFRAAAERRRRPRHGGAGLPPQDGAASRGRHHRADPGA